MIAPPPSPVPAGRVPAFERLLAGFVALVGCLVFTIAIRLDPYEAPGRPRSHGTHRQLGLPACHVFSTLGFPCPSCGMTTAVCLLARGDATAAWRTNWAGVFVGGGGLVATSWLAMLAAGVPRRPAFSAENTILALTLAGAGVVFIRYVGLVAAALTAMPP